MKLSIITICYNEPDLEKTCESIVNQTWQDFEWIVVDGGSNEETQKIWDKYKYRINTFISEPDTGRYNAMNKGIKLAKGEYLQFLHAGDYFFYNDVLRDCFIHNTYIADVLYGHECIHNTDGNYVELMPKHITKEYFYSHSIRHQAAFIKRNLFKKYGLYNENYVGVSDHEKFYIFFIKGASFKNLPYIITNFNTQGFSCNTKQRIFAISERNLLMKNLLGEKAQEFYIKDVPIKLNFFEQIFSVKNRNNHKVITILGIRIKIKRKCDK